MASPRKGASNEVFCGIIILILKKENVEKGNISGDLRHYVAHVMS